MLTTQNADPDLGWHPDGKSILLTMKSTEHSGNRLFVLDLATSELSLLESQPMKQINFHGAWSPDGGRLVFSSRHIPGPVPWQPEAEIE
ncbi:MAG: hypothetical protein ABGZ24_21900 [Fuerstiella sp.]